MVIGASAEYARANGGREARGGAAVQRDTNENGSIGHNRDGHGSRESTAGLTAPVRPLQTVCCCRGLVAQDDRQS